MDARIAQGKPARRSEAVFVSTLLAQSTSDASGGVCVPISLRCFWSVEQSRCPEHINSRSNIQLTSRYTRGRCVEGVLHLEEKPESAKWQKRVSWAECPEPYKSTIDTLANHWVNGRISHQELGFELWKLHYRCREELQDINTENKKRLLGRKSVDLSAVENEILILAEALCIATESPPLRGSLDDRDNRVESLDFAANHPIKARSFRSR